MRNPLDSLSSDRAFRTTGSLLCGLVNQPSTRGFDDPVLVGFGSIAVPLTVSETLNHFGAIGAAYASLVGVSLSPSLCLFPLLPLKRLIRIRGSSCQNRRIPRSINGVASSEAPQDHHPW